VAPVPVYVTVTARPAGEVTTVTGKGDPVKVCEVFEIVTIAVPFETADLGADVALA
jgi:hypothetical protein